MLPKPERRISVRPILLAVFSKTMSHFLMLNLSLMSRMCCWGSSALVLYTVHVKFLNLLQNDPLFQISPCYYFLQK